MSTIIQIFTTIFWFVIILVPLVAIHELGHLLMARLCGVKIPEYAIGLPLSKRLFYFRWKGIIWSFYPWLLGGFVRIFGDNDAVDEAWEKNKEDPKAAREEYAKNRVQEIITNRELQFFLEDNNLSYNEDWKEFENSQYVKGEESEKEKDKLEKFERLSKQLLTLVDWEFAQQIKSKETFFSKKWWQQTLIISGGVLFNMLTAIFIFWFLFTFITVPKTLYEIDNLKTLQNNANITYKSDYILTRIVKDSAADKIGIKSGDEIYTVAGKEMKDLQSFDEFKQLVDKNKGQEISIRFRSKEKGEFITATTKIEDKLGVGTIYSEIQYQAKNPISGMQMSLDRTSFVFTESFKVLGQIFTALLPTTQDRTALTYVGGPIAISSISSKVFQTAGVAGILDVMGLVSISLAVFNMLPIPALDGGRWVILTINKILGKRNRKLEAAAIGLTFLLMIGLGVAVAIFDVQRISTGKF